MSLSIITHPATAGYRRPVARMTRHTTRPLPRQRHVTDKPRGADAHRQRDQRRPAGLPGTVDATTITH